MGNFFALACLLLSGCTIAPHGSHATHRVWTYQPGARPDGLVRYEVITDRSAGGGALFLMDPRAQSAVLTHTNSVLQVGGSLVIGDGQVTVDPQASAITESVGKAAGAMLGEALKTAVKP